MNTFAAKLKDNLVAVAPISIFALHKMLLGLYFIIVLLAAFTSPEFLGIRG
ncbi:MAG: hypothetical protein FWF85_00210 [Clostridiales bacterium]|jgi:uncharacterized membrane protein (DUF485 family)|nr:hypothetical protein [Clostridiales bacterium]MDR2713814.1 hypothetical protein [Clostridiales bacterium]